MWVSVDEDERSINDGFFVTDPTAQTWIDFPPLRLIGTISALGWSSRIVSCRDLDSSRPGHTKLAHNRTAQPGNTDLERLARASATHKNGHGD